MKFIRRFLGAAGLLALVVNVGGQTLDTTNSRWGASNANLFYAISGVVRTTLVPGGTTAYGMVQSITDGYLFGFATSSGPPGVLPGPYDLTGTGLTAGISLHLVFTGFSAAPKYISYTGGALTAYSYNSGTGTLTFDVSTIDPVASGSDTAGTILNSVFGMKITTTGSFNYAGTVFRSDMWWGDINPMNLSYAGISPSAGVNANGANGTTATFNAYMPASFLTSIGISQPSMVTAFIQKSGGSIDLPLARTFFAAGGLDPAYSGGNYTFGGTTLFDFDGSGVDNYAVFTYSNSSWSDGNIGISAIPEPSAYALGAGIAMLALAAICRRRSRTG